MSLTKSINYLNTQGFVDNKMSNVKYDFSGKTAVITGASRGIGKAIAEAFIDSGATVINISRTNSEKESPKYAFVKKDVNDIKAITSFINNLKKENKRIDIWINNAGIYPQAKLLEVSEKDWDSTFNTNVRSLFFISKAVAHHMKENKSGIILNATSFAAIMPSINSGVYAATKAAILSLTKSMAAEWAKYGIRVNSYCPGVINTDMTSKLINKKGDKLSESISLSRFGTADEVAKVILFLCSEDSSYINGANIEINGGKFIVQNQKDA